MDGDAAQARRRRVILLNWRDRGHPEGGGSEHFIENIAAGFHERGYDVTLRCAHYPGAPHRDRFGGVSVARYGGRLTVYPRAMLHLLTARPYDLVVDVQNGVPFWTPLVSRAPRILLVHHVHREQWSVVFGPRAARLGWWLESRLAPRVYRRTRYATVSLTSKRELEGLGVDPERITVTYSGLDRPEQPVGDVALTTHPSLVALGRLVPHKRLELAIDAVAELRGDFPELTLTLVGQGWWEPNLRAYAERRGVSDRVRFTGFVDDATKLRLLAQSWVHVLPSLKEGWGLTVVEAGSLGTPSVAYQAAGGPTESIVDGVTGVLLAEGTPLASGIAPLITDRSARDRYGRAAAAYARQFTWERTVERFHRLADEAVNGGAWRLPSAGLTQPEPHVLELASGAPQRAS